MTIENKSEHMLHIAWSSGYFDGLNAKRNAIAESMRDYAFKNGKTCDAAYKTLCAMQENWGEWEDSFWGTKAEKMQGRVFCLIVAEALT
jgi:hypothetical protein